MMMQSRCAAAVIAFTLFGFLPSAARAVDHIPFTTNADGLIQVQTTVYGMPATMRVDLGAGLDIISQRVADARATITGKYATLRLTGQRVDLPIGTVGSIDVGPFHVAERTIGVWRGLDGMGIDGLLSAQAFRNVATTFDFHGHELVMEDAESFATRKLFAARAPLILRDDLGLALTVLARFDFGNGKSGLCVVDTGIPGIEIDKALAKGMGVNIADPSLKHVSTPLGDGVATTLPSITMQGAPQTSMQNPQVVFADLIDDCAVGIAFFANRGFTLDIPDRAIFVAPPVPSS